MPRRAFRFGCATVMVAATFVGFGAPVAGAAMGSIACGTKVVTSVKLHHDLVGCPGDGLVVGAPGITIDLNGHTISGTNAPGSEGIADDGYGHVVVESGQIHTFFVNGVGLRHAPASLVRGLTIRDIGAGGVDGQFSTGIAVDNSPSTRISANDISNDVVAFEADGIVVKASPGTRIDHNQLNRNSWDGLFVFASPLSRVDANVAGREPEQRDGGERLVRSYARDGQRDVEKRQCRHRCRRDATSGDRLEHGGPKRLRDGRRGHGSVFLRPQRQ